MSAHDLIFLFFSSFMALFPVINPIGSGLVIDGFLSNLDPKNRKKAINTIIINYFMISFGTLLVGHFVLLLFGLSIPVIQMAGGLLICKTALGWLSDTNENNPNENKKNQVDITNVKKQLFYPITFPITIGAGTISVLFTLMAQASIKGNLEYSVIKYATIAIALIVMAILLYIILSQGVKITEKLGETGTTILNKLIAFFTFGIGIHVFLSGTFTMISQVFNIKTSESSMALLTESIFYICRI